MGLARGWNGLCQSWQAECGGLWHQRSVGKLGDSMDLIWKGVGPGMESCARCCNGLAGVDWSPAPKEPALGIAPSLAALDDAPALKQKEWMGWAG